MAFFKCDIVQIGLRRLEIITGTRKLQQLNRIVLQGRFLLFGLLNLLLIEVFFLLQLPDLMAQMPLGNQIIVIKTQHPQPKSQGGEYVFVFAPGRQPLHDLNRME